MSDYEMLATIISIALLIVAILAYIDNKNAKK